MTIKPFTHANKAAGYENNDTLTLVKEVNDKIHAEQAKSLKQLPVDDNEYTTIDYLNERHCKDTDTIYQLQMQLKREKERGDNIAYELVTARRMYHNENAKVINLQSEVSQLDAELLKYAKLEDYLFRTMELAKDQREKYLRECGELDE